MQELFIPAFPPPSPCEFQPCMLIPVTQKRFQSFTVAFRVGFRKVLGGWGFGV